MLKECAGTCLADDDGEADEEAGADHAAHGDHGQMALFETLLQGGGWSSQWSSDRCVGIVASLPCRRLDRCVDMARMPLQTGLLQGFSA